MQKSSLLPTLPDVPAEAWPVIKNKFWIVKHQGEKIATVQATDHGLVLVKDQTRIRYKDAKSLAQSVPIRFKKIQNPTTVFPCVIDGYPTTHRPWNVLYNLQLRLWQYTQSKRSRSYRCAGWFSVVIHGVIHWELCPKLITLQRNCFKGPFRSNPHFTESQN